MNATERCPECGAELPADAPAGLCPRCLLRAGLASAWEVHIRCPHCRHPVELLDEAPLVEVTCPSCDSRFSLVDRETVPYDPSVPRSIGRFELVEQLGIGAFGAVWRARDPELDRDVAVKIPRKEQLTAAETELFLREARSAARLRHPGIVHVHEVGREEGRVYIVSDLVEGITLADRLTAGRPTHRESAELVRKLAEALAAAHAAGVIHRDLKPSNVLLDDRGEPHVTDFGLAKRDAGEITMTVEGRILGTPAYMSPEQARGDGHSADARSDVYSLGVILYELLTGEKPFRGNSTMLLHQVIHDDPPRPRRLDGSLPRDLETIALKCVEKDPARRYQTARELADELGRWLAGDPIRARPIGGTERARRWCRRNPMIALLSTAVVVSLLAGLATTLWQWRVARRNFREAEDQRSVAERRAYESRRRLVDHYVAQGSRELEEGRTRVAGVWFAEALALEEGDPEAEKSHRRRLVSLAANTPRLARMLFHDDLVRHARYTPDHTRLITISENVARVWDPATGEPITEPLEHDEYIWTLAVAPDGSRFLTLSMHPNATSDGTPHLRELRVYEVESGRLAFDPLPLEGLSPWHVAFTPDGSRFVALVGKSAQIRSAHTGELVHPPLEHGEEAHAMALSPDGSRLLTGADGTFVWDVASGERLAGPIDASIGPFSDDSRSFLLTSGFDYSRRHDRSLLGTIQLWDSSTVIPRHPPITTAGQTRAATFVLGGQRLLTVDARDDAFLWDVHEDSLEPLDDRALAGESVPRRTTTPGRRPPVMKHVGNETPAITTDGRSFATVDESSIRVWDAETGQPWLETPRPGGWADHAEFSPDGGRLAVMHVDWATNEGRLELVDLTSRETWELVTAPHHHEWARFGRDGSLATFAESGILRIWDLRTLAPRERAVRDMTGEDAWFAELDPTGRYLATGHGPHDLGVDRGGGDDWGRVRLFDLVSNTALGDPIDIDARAARATFSPAGNRLAVRDRFNDLYVIDVPGRELLRRFTDPKISFFDLAWADDETLVTVTREGGDPWTRHRQPRWIRRWDVTSGRPIGDPRRPDDLEQLVLAPRGDRYLGRRSNGEHFVADVADDRVLVALPPLVFGGTLAVFDPTGERVVTLDGANVARILDARTGRLVAPLLRDVDTFRFSRTGRLLLAWDAVDRPRVFDTTSGELIAGELNGLRLSTDSAKRSRRLGFIGPNDEAVLVVGGDGLLEWPLAEADPRPVEDWLDEMHLVAGYHLDEVGGYTPLPLDAVRSTWNEYEERRAPIDEAAVTAAWHARELRRTTRPAIAVHHLDWLLDRTPNDPRLRFQRAEALLAIGRWERAEADFRRLLERGDARIVVHTGLARALAGQDRVEEAVERFADAITAGGRVPWDAPDWQWRGGVLGISPLIEREPRNADLRGRRANFHRRLSEWRPAIEDYSEAIRLGDDGWSERVHRGGCRVEVGDLAGALADFETAEVDTYAGTWGVASAWRAAQVVRLLQGDLEAYRSSCRDQPLFDEHQAKHVLLDVLCLGPDAMRPEDRDRVEEWIVTIDVTTERERRLAAKLRIRAGRPAEGLANLRTLPPDAESRAFAALAHLALGDTEAARAALDESEELAASTPSTEDEDFRWQPPARLRILQSEVRRSLDPPEPADE